MGSYAPAAMPRLLLFLNRLQALDGGIHWRIRNRRRGDLQWRLGRHRFGGRPGGFEQWRGLGLRRLWDDGLNGRDGRVYRAPLLSQLLVTGCQACCPSGSSGALGGLGLKLLRCFCGNPLFVSLDHPQQIRRKFIGGRFGFLGSLETDCMHHGGPKPP